MLRGEKIWLVEQSDMEHLPRVRPNVSIGSVTRIEVSGDERATADGDDSPKGADGMVNEDELLRGELKFGSVDLRSVPGPALQQLMMSAISNTDTCILAIRYLPIESINCCKR